MKSTFKILFYLKRGAIRANGCALIMGRITVDGVGTQFSTKLDIKPEEWDTKGNRATGRSNASKQVNSLLEEIKASLHNIYHEMQRRDNYVTAEKVKNEFLGIAESHETLLALFAKHNADVEKLVGISKTAATLQKYKVTYNHMQSFLKDKYNVSNISLKEINLMFISDFNALANGVSMESVAKMLGHTNLQMTRHYACTLDRTVVKELFQIKDNFVMAI